MTDQMIPADKVREIIARWRDGVSDRGGLILDDLKALLPAPPRPTLADMTPKERAACQWMQADVKGMQGRRIISYPGGVGEPVGVLLTFGHLVDVDPRDVTPRPDLPRLEWPGDKKPDTSAPESTLAVGSKWDDAAALTRACDESHRDQIIALDADGYAFVWSYAAEWWEGSIPPIDPPYTIIHTGRETTDAAD